MSDPTKDLSRYGQGAAEELERVAQGNKLVNGKRIVWEKDKIQVFPLLDVRSDSKYYRFDRVLRRLGKEMGIEVPTLTDQVRILMAKGITDLSTLRQFVYGEKPEKQFHEKQQEHKIRDHRREVLKQLCMKKLGYYDSAAVDAMAKYCERSPEEREGATETLTILEEVTGLTGREEIDQ